MCPPPRPLWNHLVPFKANHGHQRHHLCRPLPGAASGEEEKTRQEH